MNSFYIRVREKRSCTFPFSWWNCRQVGVKLVARQVEGAWKKIKKNARRPGNPPVEAYLTLAKHRETKEDMIKRLRQTAKGIVCILG